MKPRYHKIKNMKKKDNSAIHVLLISLLISMALNYYVAYLYKNELLKSLGEITYYQLITWLSLAQPVIVGFLYLKAKRTIHNHKKKKFLSKKIDIEKLSPESQEKLNSLKDDIVSTEKELEALYDEELNG